MLEKKQFQRKQLRSKGRRLYTPAIRLTELIFFFSYKIAAAEFNHEFVRALSIGRSDAKATNRCLYAWQNPRDVCVNLESQRPASVKHGNLIIAQQTMSLKSP